MFAHRLIGVTDWRGSDMAARITFFRVGNGDMTLLELESGQTILLDVNIRSAADDPDDPTPDVASQLRSMLRSDQSGRTFVDAFLLTHPDQDHCAGLQKHFHLGPPSSFAVGSTKIMIHEIWSSPMVFRRASRRLSLCDDAKAFNREARRRVAVFRDGQGTKVVREGDRILLLGEDEFGKTDDLEQILVRVDEVFSRVNGKEVDSMVARVLAPFPRFDDDGDEDLHSKNNSSTILQFALSGDGIRNSCRFLTGGDAEVAIWRRLWWSHRDRADWLDYHILQAPHHCSWHSLSFDSWSEKGHDAVVCKEARNALSQALDGAVIVSSSRAIQDDHNDPPCIRAKQEYEMILRDVPGGEFVCVGEPEHKPEALQIEIGRLGPRITPRRLRKSHVIGSGAVGRTQQPHGSCRSQ